MSASSGDRILVWDLPVRIFHWGIVLAVIGSYLTQHLEGDWFRWHVWCGYAVIVLVCARIVWGFVGPRHARFSSFVRGPREIVRYARSLVRGPHAAYPGHNPLGALMVLALLALLAAQGVTGLFANDEIMNAGPLFGHVSVETSDRLTDWHETIFDLLLVLSALHVLAVVLYLVVYRENLIVPMLTGRKRAGTVDPREAIAGSRTWLALLIAGAVAAVLAIAVRTAPEATLSFF